MENELREQVKLFLSSTTLEEVLTDTAKQNRFIELHHAVLGYHIDCSTCPKKVRRAMGELSKAVSNPNFNLKTNTMTIKFKNPKTRVYSSYAKNVITQGNLTEGNAIGVLAMDAKNADLFETATLPEDWQDQVDALKGKYQNIDERKAAGAAAAAKKAEEKKATAEAASKARRAAQAVKDKAAREAAAKKAGSAKPAAEAPKKSDAGKDK